MKLTLEDILTRVTRTEQDRAEYNRLAESWEKMWRLEVFNRTTSEAISRDAQEQVTLPGPYNIVQLGQRLISTTPKIDVPPAAGTEHADDGAKNCERWLSAMFQQTNRQQQRNIIADASWWSIVRGRNVFDVRWVLDDLPAAMKKTHLPLLIRTLDPLNVGIKRGPLYTLWAYHKYKDERILVKNRYKKLKLPVQVDHENGSNGENELIEVIDFWWHDPDTGAVWNAIIVGDEFAKKPTETDYPAIPLIEIYGDSSPLSKEAYKGVSLLHPIMDLWPYQCRLASQMGTGLLYYFWPPVTVMNEYGQPVDNFKLRPGETTPVPWGTKIDQHQLSPNVPLAQAMMSQIDGAMQESTFPGVMYGKAPGDLQAGFGVSLLADQAKGRIRSFLENLEFGLAQVCQLALGLIAAMDTSDDGVSAWGMDERSKSPYRLTIKKEEIADYNEVVVSLKPQVAQDDMQRQTLGLRLVEGGIISKERFRSHFLPMALPPDEDAVIEWEQAQQSDPMKPYIYSLAMKKRLGPDWGKYIDVNAPPPPPFGPPPQQGPPPGGPGGPMMPPGGPGGPMMPPGGPPQGPPGPPMPPQGMSGPPPPMMPPGPPPGPPGMPPLPPGVTPEMVMMAIQMIMQHGPPPGMAGGPPGPPMGLGVPGGPPMPPGQSDQMLTPPTGGGIPAEMQGQLTPEALNLPPGMNPLEFAALSGRHVEPADELAMIAGQKSVGGKKRK